MPNMGRQARESAEKYIEKHRKDVEGTIAHIASMAWMDGYEAGLESGRATMAKILEPKSARLRCADGVDRTIALSESASHPPAHLAEPN